MPLLTDEDEDPSARKNRMYSSRLSRARAANQRRGSHVSSHSSSGFSTFSPASGVLDGLSPMSLTGQNGSPPPRRSATSSLGSGLETMATRPEPAPAPPMKAPEAVATAPSVMVTPEEGGTTAFWEWNASQKLIAVVEHSQLLKVLDAGGKTIYRVQLPREGRCLFLGWEPSGAALAAVQDHGGAFLWFPSKPDCVQQWEGMQFSSQLLRTSTLKRNAHFDTCFAAWSEASKLVLGLADGNFACWDLRSNETFISRKHFAGNHKGAISCGAWGMGGQILALASMNQLKISQPLLNASWESTAAKLALPDNDLCFHSLSFSPSGATLAALAGTSIFRHLGLYAVKMDATGGGSGGRRASLTGQSRPEQVLTAVGEMHPNATLGGIQEMVWLDNEMIAVVTTNGYVKMLQYSHGEGTLAESQHKPSAGGVASASLCKRSGHLAIVDAKGILFFDPLLLSVAAVLTLPPLGETVRNQKLQACPSGEMLLLGRSDGTIVRIPIPEMPKADLTLLSIRRRGDDDDDQFGAPSTPGGGATTSASSRHLLGATCGKPFLICSVSAAEGATSGYGTKLHVAWSQMRGLLCIVNGKNEVIVQQVVEDGSLKTCLQEQLPEADVISVSWDPSSQSVLAIAMRKYGVALWDTKGDAGVQMWSGMHFKHAFFPLMSTLKAFDPLIAKWNYAGQLAVGMKDGSFAVWDSMSLQISTSHMSGKHGGSITAGDWYSSLFAPALALASKSTIKVSQGFEGVEWQATACKVRIGSSGRTIASPRFSSPLTSPMRRKSLSPLDPEGLDFKCLKFSPSGKYLAAIASPTMADLEQQVHIYELADARKTLLGVRECRVSEPEQEVIGIQWLVDNSLLVFVRTPDGGSIRTLPVSMNVQSSTWPRSGAGLPGTLVDAAATPQGLVTLAFATPEGKGALLLLSCPTMGVVAEMPLDAKPQTMGLTALKSGVASLTLGFEGGGVDVWELPTA